MKVANAYVDLDGTAISLDRLNADERRLLGRLDRRSRAHPDCCDFDNYWISELIKFYETRGLDRASIVKTPIYQIAQDLSARLGIAQGMIREPDYLDPLEDLVLNHFPSRRAFCKASGLRENTLDAVLAGREDLSLANLSKALKRAGYRLRIVPAGPSKRTG